ncbi:efflux RND transporter periplasmic adaptor subunit [Pseudoblastomonas halimionae]|uniref:Efflux RND transporter periplasmic adaptor subunit n=1 Tax=Alteriqipengyuania halimionae TaxID=1926630 RepID=A0A6I4U8W8_9SPHN|nr:efflux RND transporter periplasmic adaptor subunit [Alteriqipengyuania halimionae]
MNAEMQIETQDAARVDDPFALDADERRKRRRLWIVLGAIVVLVAGGLWFLTRGGEEQVPAAVQEQEEAGPAITVMVPGSATIEGEINATGTLAARREMPVGVQGSGGQVSRVLVDAGDWVNAGQILAVLDRSVQSQQVSQQRAQVRVAESDARLAQANLDRALKLVDRGFISTADVDRLTATRDAAVARVEVAKAQLGELQARTAQLSIVAPAAGLILERNIEPGQVVGGGTGAVFLMARGGEMELMAQLGEDDLARISTGVTAQVTPVGLDRTFTGQVWQIDPVIDSQSRQGTARIALSYAPGLKPGGFATATIASGAVVAPRLPESAIQDDDGQSYVYIVDKDDKIVRRDVTTGLITDDGIAIVDGLDGTERVVLRAAGFLKPGEKVSPQVQKRRK